MAAGFANILLGLAYPFLIYIVALTALLYWFLSLLAQSYHSMAASPHDCDHVCHSRTSLPLLPQCMDKTMTFFRAWDSQAGTPSAPFPHYLLSFGIMLLLALWFWWKKPEERRHFAILWMWILATGLLLYSPLSAQRRFIQGVHVAFSVLAAAGLVLDLLPRAQRTWTWLAITSRPRYTTEKINPLYIGCIFTVYVFVQHLPHLRCDSSCPCHPT